MVIDLNLSFMGASEALGTKQEASQNKSSWVGWFRVHHLGAEAGTICTTWREKHTHTASQSHEQAASHKGDSFGAKWVLWQRKWAIQICIFFAFQCKSRGETTIIAYYYILSMNNHIFHKTAVFLPNASHFSCIIAQCHLFYCLSYI